MANSFEQRPMNRSSKFDAPLIGNLNANPSNDSHTNGIINNPPTNSYNTYPNDDVHDPMHSIHSNQFYPHHDDMGAFGMDIPIGIGQSYDSPSLGYNEFGAHSLATLPSINLDSSPPINTTTTNNINNNHNHHTSHINNNYGNNDNNNNNRQTMLNHSDNNSNTNTVSSSNNGNINNNNNNLITPDRNHNNNNNNSNSSHTEHNQTPPSSHSHSHSHSMTNIESHSHFGLDEFPFNHHTGMDIDDIIDGQDGNGSIHPSSIFDVFGRGYQHPLDEEETMALQNISDITSNFLCSQPTTNRSDSLNHNHHNHSTSLPLIPSPTPTNNSINNNNNNNTVNNHPQSVQNNNNNAATTASPSNYNHHSPFHPPTNPPLNLPPVSMTTTQSQKTNNSNNNAFTSNGNSNPSLHLPSSHTNNNIGSKHNNNNHSETKNAFTSNTNSSMNPNRSVNNGSTSTTTTNCFMSSPSSTYVQPTQHPMNMNINKYNNPFGPHNTPPSRHNNNNHPTTNLIPLHPHSHNVSQSMHNHHPKSNINPNTNTNPHSLPTLTTNTNTTNSITTSVMLPSLSTTHTNTNTNANTNSITPKQLTQSSTSTSMNSISASSSQSSHSSSSSATTSSSTSLTTTPINSMKSRASTIHSSMSSSQSSTQSSSSSCSSSSSSSSNSSSSASSSASLITTPIHNSIHGGTNIGLHGHHNHSSMSMEVEQDLTPTTSKPPPYHIIKKNQFVSRKRKSWKDAKEKYKCDCHEVIGDDCSGDNGKCYNRLFQYECVRQACAIEDDTGDASKCKNRRFQRAEWKKVIVKAAGKKGWGLFAGEDIKYGEFVIEYVGEIIDEKECKKRLLTTYHNASKFYILKLEGGKKGESIDATQKGGPARYMNHSCDPNCKTQKWTVGAELCLGFFADRDIAKGEELTFNYQFQRIGSIKQKCYCGARNCTGFLGDSQAPKSPRTKSMGNSATKKGMNKKKRTYRKNKKIVKRSMDERLVINQYYKDLVKLGTEIEEENDDDMDLSNKMEKVMNKCMAKGRLIKRQYIANITNSDLLDEFKNGDIEFNQIIRPYEADSDINNIKSTLLKEPEIGDKLLNVNALNQFENIIAKQYEIGSDFELEHLPKMKNVNQLLNQRKGNNNHNQSRNNKNCNCGICLLYGVNACKDAIRDMFDNANNDNNYNSGNHHRTIIDLQSDQSTTNSHSHYHHQRSSVHNHMMPPKSYANIPNVNTNLIHHHDNVPPPLPPHMNEQTVKSYLKLKQESESKVMEAVKNSKQNNALNNMDNNNNNKSSKDKRGRAKNRAKSPKKDAKNKKNKSRSKKSRKKDKDKSKDKDHNKDKNTNEDIDDYSDTNTKDHSDADSQLAANLHKQLNKRHLRPRRTRSSQSNESNASSSNTHNNDPPNQSGAVPTNYTSKSNNNESTNTNTKPKTKIMTSRSQLLPPIPRYPQAVMGNNKTQKQSDQRKHKNSRGKTKKQNKISSKIKNRDNLDMENDADIDDVDETQICPKCGIKKEELKTKGTWSRHLHSKHTYYCKTCPKQFTTANFLADHEKSEHNGIRPKSPDRKSVKGSNKLSKMNSTNKIAKYSKSRPKTEKTKLKAKMSKMESSDGNVSNNDGDGRSKSSRRKKDNLPDQCGKCGRDRGETPKSHWQKHLQTDHRFPCPHCKWRFSHRKKYTEHMSAYHSNWGDDNTNTNTTPSLSSIIREEQPKSISLKKRKRKRNDMEIDHEQDESDSEHESDSETAKDNHKTINIDNDKNENNEDIKMKQHQVKQQQGTKRKYHHRSGEDQPRKKRKTTAISSSDNKPQQTKGEPNNEEQKPNIKDNEDIFKNDPKIKAMMEERDRELRLYTFEDFYRAENEELMVSIYNKIERNDTKYAKVFKEEESMNAKIKEIMKAFHPKTSHFNELILKNKSNNQHNNNDKIMKDRTRKNSVSCSPSKTPQTQMNTPTPNPSTTPLSMSTSPIKYMKPQTAFNATKLNLNVGAAATKVTNSMVQYMPNMGMVGLGASMTMSPNAIRALASPLQNATLQNATQQFLLQQLQHQQRQTSAHHPIIIQQSQPLQPIQSVATPLTHSTVTQTTLGNNINTNGNKKHSSNDKKIVPHKVNNAHFSAANMKMTTINPNRNSNNTKNKIKNNPTNNNNNNNNKSQSSNNNNSSSVNSYNNSNNNSATPSAHTPMSHTSNTSSTTASRSSSNTSNSNQSNHKQDRYQNNNDGRGRHNNHNNNNNNNNRNNYHHRNNSYHQRQDYHHNNNNNNNNNSYNRNRYGMNHYQNRSHHHNNNHHHHHHHHRVNNGVSKGWQNTDPENKTLFIDGIPLNCSEESVLETLKKHGSIKDIKLKTKQNKQAQYANVVCFQRHICEALIQVGQKPMSLKLSDGTKVVRKLLIQYHNQKKVDEAKRRFFNDKEKSIISKYGNH